jgi:hypothetical protein
VNLSGDDDIRNQRERGNQHGPLAWILGISDCDLIHVVEVTGALSILGRVAVETNHVEAEGKGQPLYGSGSSGGYPKAGERGHAYASTRRIGLFLRPRDRLRPTQVPRVSSSAPVAYASVYLWWR